MNETFADDSDPALDDIDAIIDEEVAAALIAAIIIRAARGRR